MRQYKKQHYVTTHRLRYSAGVLLHLKSYVSLYQSNSIKAFTIKSSNRVRITKHSAINTLHDCTQTEV